MSKPLLGCQLLQQFGRLARGGCKIFQRQERAVDFVIGNNRMSLQCRSLALA